MSTKRFDVAVIGGGVAGLSAATTLGRSLRSVVVLDTGRPRNAPAAGVHNLLGQDGISPHELLTRGRAEARGYGADIRTAEVTAVTRNPGDDFEIHLSEGEPVHARRLLLTVGLTDELPDVPGVAELWGSSVLHCPYCHGWEVRGRRIGVLGSTAMSAHQAMMFRQLSDHVTLFTHTMPAAEPEVAEQLSALGIEVVEARVDHLDIVDGTDGSSTIGGVALEDGRRVDCDALVVAPRFVAHGDLYTGLGGTLTPHPFGEYIDTGPMGATAIPGVWAAGNVADLQAMVATSMGQGVAAGAAINADLIAENARAAVAGAPA